MNKAEKTNRNRLMIAGVQKHYGPDDTILVDGVPTKQTVVVARLQAPIGAGDVTATAEAAYHKAVADELAADTAADDTYQGLKSYFLSVLKKTPEVLADYGLSLVVKQVPTAEVKAAAAAKRKATMAARGTDKGKRQRAAIKAPTPTTPTPKA